jgi:DnaK suppressor protein
MRSDKARRRLEQERERLRELLDSPAVTQLQTNQQESSGDLSSFDQHPGDAGSDTVEREQALAIAEHTEAALARVEDALERLDRGEYGTCARCGVKIPDERLEARPESLYCLEHQVELERSV